MPTDRDRKLFRNEDLLLKVSPSVDPAKWDDRLYELYLDELCGTREYQKDAIRTALRYLLGGEYENLRSLAKANYDQNTALEERYGSWANFERHLQLPNQLAASLDLATGTGKSYVMYGIASIMLATGTVDRVLVLCPSTTIENGLIEKFRSLATNSDLRDLLPPDSALKTPRIINGSESIVPGSICVENYHAVLEHVGSSIRDSLLGKGQTTLVLNDEAHHVANDSKTAVRKWKEFLLDQQYEFRYTIGVSGTCYVGNDYFSDVIFRYSLRQAIEERYVKNVHYVAEMPLTGDSDEKWQLIRSRHEDTRKRLLKRNIRPLTIVVTSTIARCTDLSEELVAFLSSETGKSVEETRKEVLAVYNNSPDLSKLGLVDTPASTVEWIVAVSMLNEGWDVKRVFQIVPHEERAFNSKLLISQVLGRGLRVPDGWTGEQPEVTVFNHDRWAPSIRHLVDEILEIERRISTNVIPDSPYHFDLHNIDYQLETISVEKPMERQYKLFEKDFIDLASEPVTEKVSISFERATTGDVTRWQTEIHHKSFTAREIAQIMYERLEEADSPDENDEEPPFKYTDTWTVEKLEELVQSSLLRLNVKVATDRMRQRFLSSLGTLRRRSSQNVRYIPQAKEHVVLSTKSRHSDSVSASELRNTKTLFFNDLTRSTIIDEQLDLFDTATEPGSGFKVVHIANRYHFKSPLNAAIADYENERRFLGMLTSPDNAAHYDAWIKSTSTGFYEIDYAWKKGNAPKRGKFNPDFFIKVGNTILVIEIKGNEELQEPSEENRKKNEYAITHFERVNENLKKQDNPLSYHFHFLTPSSFNAFFQELRDGRIRDYRSELDVRLREDE